METGSVNDQRWRGLLRGGKTMGFTSVGIYSLLASETEPPFNALSRPYIETSNDIMMSATASSVPMGPRLRGQQAGGGGDEAACLPGDLAVKERMSRESPLPAQSRPALLTERPARALAVMGKGCKRAVQMRPSPVVSGAMMANF